MADAFSLYAPFVQEFIYAHEWSSLRPIQVAAADVLFHSDANLILAASTASGKTEAAFFPILTDLWKNPAASVGALYVAPLKALINDQFARLTFLAREGGVPIWHWHGDVSADRKRKLLKNPSGILQITPESLEALLMRRHAEIPHLFHDLRYVVVDEIHSLLRGDRGMQTMCLLTRLAREAGCNPRRIGLSATIGDIDSAAQFFSLGTHRPTLTPKVAAPKSHWRLSLEHFYTDNQPQAAADSNGREPEDPAEDLIATDRAPRGADPGLAYIFEHSRGTKCLVFANSREEAETVTTTLRQYCEANHEADRFLIHHGNLSPSLREEAEHLMKDDAKTLTTVTTSTLELGIDIGRLQRAFQIDAPFTVSAFLQRMGRTGRRGQPQEMRFVIREERPESRDMLPATFAWKELQAIAVIQLYLEQKWVEPAQLHRKHFSLLFHQTMSILYACGEMTAAELAARVLTLPAFVGIITKEDYQTLLQHLLATKLLEKTEEGRLILGTRSESFVNSYKFFAVFKENEEYTVRDKSREIGTIVRPPPVGEKIALAGRVWVVDEIDPKRHLLYVSLVKGKVPAYFGLCPGDIDTKILERMRDVLAENTIYPYVRENAAARLRQMRVSARMAGMPQSVLVFLGGDSYAFFPWLGTYAFLALERILKIKCSAQLELRALESSRPYFLQFHMKASPQEFFSVLASEAEKDFAPLDLLYPNEVPLFDKFDEYLPAELVRKGFAQSVLDIDGVRRRIRSWGRIDGGRLANQALNPAENYLPAAAKK